MHFVGQLDQRYWLVYISRSQNLRVHMLVAVCWLELQQRLNEVCMGCATETPYSFGLFEFHMFCPNTFPESPPLVNLCAKAKAPAVSNVEIDCEIAYAPGELRDNLA